MNDLAEQSEKISKQRGMRAFILLWAGQCISQIGSALTGFALGIAVYQKTGSVTRFAWILLFTTLPGMIMLPFAGALTDRWNRGRTMILSDAGAFFGTLALLLLLYSGSLQLWHIYVAMGCISVFAAFRWPAYSAATTLLVAKENLGRASGLMQMGPAAAQILAPALGGFLTTALGVELVVLFDLFTYIIALATLIMISVPKTVAGNETQAAKGSILGEILYSFKYMKERPGLLALLVLFAAANFLVGIVSVLATPLILSFASVSVLGTVLSIGGFGMLVGTLVMAAWGGPKRRIHGVLGFLMLSGLCIVLAGLKPSVALVTVVCFIFFLSFPITNGSSQAIWQTKVAPDVQGRVFAVRALVATSCLPAAYFLAGPLADNVFEPLLTDGGALAPSVGKVIGTGPGRGIAFLFILLGTLCMIITAISYSYPRLRLVEEELVDAIPEVENLESDSITPPPAAAAFSTGESRSQGMG